MDRESNANASATAFVASTLIARRACVAPARIHMNTSRASKMHLATIPCGLGSVKGAKVCASAIFCLRIRMAPCPGALAGSVELNSSRAFVSGHASRERQREEIDRASRYTRFIWRIVAIDAIAAVCVCMCPVACMGRECMVPTW